MYLPILDREIKPVLPEVRGHVLEVVFLNVLSFGSLLLQVVVLDREFDVVACMNFELILVYASFNLLEGVVLHPRVFTTAAKSDDSQRHAEIPRKASDDGYQHQNSQIAEKPTKRPPVVIG